MMLLHRCLSCGHPEEWHANNDCSHGWCACSATQELAPRYSAATGEIVTEVCPPGASPFGAHYHPKRTKTCGCEACHEAYAAAIA